MVKVKAAASDMALNIVATLVPMISLQLVILPLVSRSMDADDYGIAVAVIALFGLIPLTLGNVINNVRLLRNQDYADKGVSGDFPIFTAVLALIAAVSTGVCSWFSGETSFAELVLITLGSFLMLVTRAIPIRSLLAAGTLSGPCGSMAVSLAFPSPMRRWTMLLLPATPPIPYPLPWAWPGPGR